MNAAARDREQRLLAEGLGEVSAALNSTLELDDVLDLILDRVASVVPFSTGTIMMLDDAHAEVVRAKGFESPIVGVRLLLTEARNLGRVMSTGEPSLLNDTRSSPDWKATPEVEHIRSNMTAAIKADGQVVGAISVDSDQKEAFTEELLTRLRAFADQAGNAVRNASLYQESQAARTAEHEQRLLAEGLGEVSAALNSTLELDDVLDLILDRVAGVVPFSTGTIMMLDDEHAEVVRAKGFDTPIVGLRLLLADVRNLGRVMSTGEPSLLNDTRASPDWTPSPATNHIRSNMTVAIEADGRVVGAISVDSDQKEAFTVELLTRLKAFADQAGSAVRNARLYQESQAARRHSDQLLRVILPDQIAEELKANDHVQARRHEDVAVLFADIVGFTQYCDTHDPEEVLEALTEITGRFEEIAEHHGLEKLKTIGDSFMATAGLLEPVPNPDLLCVKAGLDMIAACRDLASQWTVRVGVHSGELVAGVLGTEKFLFDVWGDTVNTASRVESNGVPNEVSVSRTSWNRISDVCRGRSRGKVAVKGKGEMEMFVIEGLR